MILTLKRTPGIYLVGFMASGKTTVGRMLAKQMGWRFVDTDHEIETVSKRSIPDIFESDGEQAFRDLETDILRTHVVKISRGTPTVVALGGGTFTREENQRLCVDHGVSIWLDCSWDVVGYRLAHSPVDRPLARDLTRLRTLFEQRRADYAKADYVVTVRENNSSLVCNRVLQLPCFQPDSVANR